MTFVKGKSGNPNGRPKKRTLASVVHENGAVNVVETIKQRLVAIVNEGTDNAAIPACKELLDRIEGKAGQKKDEDQIGDRTAQRLCELAERLLISKPIASASTSESA